MSLSIATLLAAPMALVLLAAVVSALTARPFAELPIGERRPRTLFRSVPMLVGAGMVAYGAFAGGYQGRVLFLAGVLAVLGANVVLAPVLVQRAGAVLGSSGRVVLQLAGRRMEHDPRRWARPFVATGTLAIIGFVVVGELAIFRQDEPSRPSSDIATATVRWQRQGQDDIVEFANSMHPDQVYPVSSSGPEMAMGATCSSLAGLFGFTDCSPSAPYSLSDGAAGRLAAALGLRPESLRLVPPGQMENVSAAVVLSMDDVLSLHEHTRTAAMRSLTGPSVVSEVTFAEKSSPLVTWLMAGLGLAGSTLCLAAIITAVDRSLGAVAPRVLLMRLGVARRRLRMLEAAVFGASFATIVGSSVVIGGFVASLIVSQTAADIPVVAFGRLSAALAGAGIAGTALFWGFHRVSPGDGSED